jgi:hypothetical protein
MSLDESIGKIEVDPKEEASVVEAFQVVLDKHSDVRKKDKLLKFFKPHYTKRSNNKNVSKFSRNMFTEIRCEIYINHFVEIITQLIDVKLYNVLEIHCSCPQWFLDFSLKAGWRG